MRALLPVLLLMPAVANAIPVSSTAEALVGGITPDVMHDVADGGDANLDGIPDMLLGDPLADNVAGFQVGSARIHTSPVPLPGYGTTEFVGLLPFDRFGYAVDGLGDVNCDGFTDVIVGSPGDDTNGLDAGAAYVFFGPHLPGTVSAGAATLSLYGELPGDQAGHAVGFAPDVDGDGCNDLVIGAPFYDAGSLTDAGAAYVVSSQAAMFFGATPLTPAVAMQISGDQPGANFGWSVSAMRDHQGDVVPDVLVGAPGWSGRGAAAVVFGPFFPHVSALTDVPMTPFSFVLGGEQPGDRFGFSVDGRADADGDGLSDILVGAPSHSLGGTIFSTGAAYQARAAWLPSAPGVVVPAQPVSTKWFGTGQNDNTGWDVAFIGDLSFDGRTEWVVGAPFKAMLSGGVGTAAAFVSQTWAGSMGPGLAYPMPTAPAIDAVPPFLGVGYSVSGAGDRDGDGVPDPLVGAYHTSAMRNGATGW